MLARSAPAVPPVSVHQCQLSVLIHATCQCPVPHFSAQQCHVNATYQCPSELPFSVTHQCSQCHLSMPVSATYQCCQ
ncbi:unnamed protein product [Staurois parvus]|uniref:Uncharacterized protein n=1 Tax=Staurois parvus TaxID=386267 RepID=A0ABN9GDS4_9NEOB|nr:unnamed protein product [Staurois parvus]